MLLDEYLSAGNALFTNTRNLFDANLLNGRFRAKFSTRTMRVDLTPEQIAANGQNVIDCNETLLQQLFDYAEQFNPTRTNQTTTTKTGDKTDVITDDNTRKNTGDRTTTNDISDTTTGKSTDTPNTSTALTKSAYNAVESKPAEISTTTGTNAAETTATITRTGTVTNSDNLTETNSRDYTLHNNYDDTTTTYGVTGADEIRAAFDKFIMPYDYLCNLIAREVCELVW